MTEPSRNPAPARRRLLVLSPFEAWPLWQGTVVRTFFLTRHLAQSNEVWLAARSGKEEPPAEHPAAEMIYNHPNRYAQLFNPPFLWQLWRLVRRQRISTIVLSQITGGIHALLLHWLTGAKLVFDNHNVEYLRFRRMGVKLWPLVMLFEGLLCHVADRVLCVSEVDRDHLQRTFRLPADRFLVIPNGADVVGRQARQVDRRATREALGLPLDRPLALFFGTLTHKPNEQAAWTILEEFIPRLQALGKRVDVVMAGRGDTRALRARALDLAADVHFLGYVDDIEALIKSCDVTIAPLTAGSGTRLKIIESVACGVPVVSTTVGAEGLRLDILDGLVSVTDNWDDFAQHVVALVDSPQATGNMEKIIAHYDWQSILKDVALPQ